LFDEGKLTFNSTNIVGIPPNSKAGRLEIDSNNSVIFEFEDPYIRYLQDTDNNGVMDLGTYFADANGIIARNVSSAELVAIADMSRPPASNMPYYSSLEDIFTTQPIDIRLGFYNAPDTPRDELNISYKWYLNDDLIPDQNIHVLPARLAFYPNYLLVAMVVSDVINVVESEPLRLVIADSLEEIVVSNKPVNVTTGDALLFNAQLSDPDKPNDRLRPSGALIGAPDGVTFNENGDVSWQVPDKLLFSRQTFVFTFSTTNLNNNLK
jgi:hypothetical protein